MLEKLLRSGAQAKALGVVLEGQPMHLREIARRAGISPPQAKKELEIMHELGIVRKERKGNMVFFPIDEKCLFLQELRGIYAKMEGVVPALKKELAKIAGLKYCFVYGSYANGKFGGKSDIDLLCIGDNGVEKFDAAVYKLQKNTGREINYIFWSMDDFAKKASEKGAFFNAVLKEKKLWIIGGEDEFGGASQKRGDKKG